MTLPLRVLTVVAVLTALCPSGARAQRFIDISYGVDRNVDDGQANRDGWMNLTVEWPVAPGLSVGLGSDHQFRGATPALADHLSFTIHALTSYQLGSGRLAPFVRAGLGAGRAPCQGDACGGGWHLRGSGGLRLRLAEAVRLTGEVGVSRVSRPYGGVGIGFAF